MTDTPTRDEIEDAAGRLHTLLSGLTHLGDDLREIPNGAALGAGLRDALTTMIDLAHRDGVAFIKTAEQLAERADEVLALPQK